MRRLIAAILLLALAAPAWGMDTILTARSNGMQSAGLTRFSQLSGSVTALATNLYAYTWMPAAGSISSFTFLLTAAPGSGQQTDFTIYKNGGSEITFSISGTATTATPAGTITVAAGDYIYVQAVASAGAAGADVLFHSTFTSTVSGEGLITGGSGSGSNSTTADRFAGCMGVSAWSATAADMRQAMPTGGTISHLYCSDNTVLGSGSYAITLYVNGSPSTLVATLTSAGTTANDVTHSVAVAAGDLVEIGCIPSSPDGTKRVQWGMKWTPTTNGESVLLGGSANDLSSTASEFNFLTNSAGTWSTTEANFQSLWPAVELKYLTIALSASPGANPNSYAFTVRDDGSGTALDVTITDPATTGRDVTHSVTPAAGSLICLGVIPTDTPTAVDAYWGVVAYIAPPATSRRVMVVQ